MPSDKDLPESPSPRRRRTRYAGTHPQRYADRYKEHQPDRYPGIHEHVRSRGGTPAGTHVPVLAQEVLALLQPADDAIIADCTLGYGGHAELFLQHLGPAGRLIGLDVDQEQLNRTRERLQPRDARLHLHRSHFAGLPKILHRENIPACDMILADLGVSSMQIDDPARGFSYKHNGPLDMRMDLRLPRTAADLLATLSAGELTRAFTELGDEPDAAAIAEAIIHEREHHPLQSSADLSKVVFDAKGLSPAQWRNRPRERQRDLHPAARVFQALRMLVNDELAGLRQFLRIVPHCLKPAGRVAVISFHSGEDHCVAAAFEQGRIQGVYADIAAEPVIPTPQERRDNPRSRSARLRWASKPPAE